MVIVYGAENGRGAWAEMDPFRSTRPPCGVCAFMSRNASCMHRKGATRLRLTQARYWSSGMSSRGWRGVPEPALKKPKSRRPARRERGGVAKEEEEVHVVSLVRPARGREVSRH